MEDKDMKGKTMSKIRRSGSLGDIGLSDKGVAGAKEIDAKLEGKAKEVIEEMDKSLEEDTKQDQDGFEKLAKKGV